MIDLTVSIVNTNNRSLLEPCLESILAHTQGISYEIYVVDNASTDGSAEMVRAKFPQAHLIQNDTRLGFTTNHNMVLRRSRGRYVLIFNEDTVVLPGALEHMVAFLDDHPEAGALGCKLLNPDGTVQRSCWRGFPSLLDALVEALYLWRLVPNARLVRMVEIPVSEMDQVLEVDHVLGACMMVRSETVEQVGLLDESFFLFLEETDWCYRMKQEGWKIYYTPDAQIIHYGQQSVSRDPLHCLPMINQSYCRYYRKHYGESAKVLLLKAILGVGAALRIGLWTERVLIGRRGDQGKAMIRGYWQVLRQLPGF